MNSKHQRTLEVIFQRPVNKNLLWADIESLLMGLGAKVAEGNGSRVKFDLNGLTLAIHRPHNPKTARAYQIELVREFLEMLGVKP